MARARRIVVPTIALVGVAIVGSVVWTQEKMLTELPKKLNQQLSLVANAYRTIAETHAFPLQTSITTPEQQSTLMSARESHEKLGSETLPMREKLATIALLQISLHRFLAVSDDGAITQREEYKNLQRAMGERGDVIQLLNDYNNTAKQWNDLLSAQVSGLLAQLTFSKDDRERMPMLRFDGQQEFMTIIHL
jgi:hypothetical protein